MWIWIVVTGIGCMLYSEWMAHRAQKNVLKTVQEIVGSVVVPLAAQVQELKLQVARLESQRSRDAA